MHAVRRQQATMARERSSFVSAVMSGTIASNISLQPRATFWRMKNKMVLDSIDISLSELSNARFQSMHAKMGDRLLSIAGTGKNCALSVRLSNPSPVLDKNHAPMGPRILSSTGAGVWRKAPKTFPDSGSVLDNLQSMHVKSNKKTGDRVSD